MTELFKLCFTLLDFDTVCYCGLISTFQEKTLFPLAVSKTNVWRVGGEEAGRHVVDPNYVKRGGGIQCTSLYLSSPIS